jgi:transcriptional regulator with XRE-family HTH domain
MFEPLPDMIRTRREERGLTQEKLARLAGVSRGQLIAFEKGEQNISLIFLIKLAKALELTDLRIGELSLRPAPPDITNVDDRRECHRRGAAGDQQCDRLGDEVNAAAAAVSRLVDRVKERGEEVGGGKAGRRAPALRRTR